MSGTYVKINGQFKLAQINAKYGNNWRDTFQVYHKRNNQWKEVYSYQYIPSNWSECSKSCGGGIQTRTISCRRSDGIYKDNNYCRKYGLTLPPTTQQCNTHSCTWYFYGEKDDCLAMWIKDTPYKGWTQVLSNCGAHGSYGNDMRWYAFSSAAVDTSKEIIYVKYTFWDTNGTSWHTHVRLCTAQNRCTPMLIAINKQGAGRQSYFWIEWNIKNNTARVVACSNNSSNVGGCDPGYNACSNSGIGFVGCGTGEPF